MARRYADPDGPASLPSVSPASPTVPALPPPSLITGGTAPVPPAPFVLVPPAPPALLPPLPVSRPPALFVAPPPPALLVAPALPEASTSLDDPPAPSPA